MAKQSASGGDASVPSWQCIHCQIQIHKLPEGFDSEKCPFCGKKQVLSDGSEVPLCKKYKAELATPTANTCLECDTIQNYIKAPVLEQPSHVVHQGGHPSHAILQVNQPSHAILQGGHPRHAVNQGGHPSHSVHQSGHPSHAVHRAGGPSPNTGSPNISGFNTGTGGGSKAGTGGPCTGGPRTGGGHINDLNIM